MISADQLEKTVFWYLDTNALFANANQNAGFEARRLLTTQNASGNAPQEVNVIIPLNRYSFFEVLEDKMLIPMQLQFVTDSRRDYCKFRITNCRTSKH